MCSGFVTCFHPPGHLHALHHQVSLAAASRLTATINRHTPSSWVGHAHGHTAPSSRCNKSPVLPSTMYESLQGPRSTNWKSSRASHHPTGGTPPPHPIQQGEFHLLTQSNWGNSISPPHPTGRIPSPHPIQLGELHLPIPSNWPHLRLSCDLRIQCKRPVGVVWRDMVCGGGGAASGLPPHPMHHSLVAEFSSAGSTVQYCGKCGQTQWTHIHTLAAVGSRVQSFSSAASAEF